MPRTLHFRFPIVAAIALGRVFAGVAFAAAGEPATKSPGVYDRPIHLTYALSRGKVLQESDEQILAALDQVPGGVTSVNPFLLNVMEPARYTTILNALKARGIAVFVGVGKNPGAAGWGIDSANMRKLAQELVPFSDSIRIDNLEGFYEREGREPIQSYIDYLRSIGFRHIMLNPWPADKGAAIPFKGAESTIIEITLKHNHQTGEVFAAPTNWQAKERRIAMVRALDPSIKILVNYESEPQHRALARLETEKPGSSIAALEVAAAQCETSGWYWCPPWTKIYDPVKLNTWTWMAARLGRMYRIDAPAAAAKP